MIVNDHGVTQTLDADRINGNAAGIELALDIWNRAGTGHLAGVSW
jgi:hypothetical protein